MFSIKEASQQTGVSEKALYKWAKRHNLGQKVGFGWVLFQKDLDFINQKKANKNGG